MCYKRWRREVITPLRAQISEAARNPCRSNESLGKEKLTIRNRSDFTMTVSTYSLNLKYYRSYSIVVDSRSSSNPRTEPSLA